jgi:micrococcal nuclease
MRRAISATFLFVLIALPALAQKRLTAAEAKDHIGEVATVCGKVVSANYAAGSRGQPTFLNLDKPYPQHIFTVVIWGENRAMFGRPEVEYRDKQICVTGKIQSYRGVPQIEARSPNQIRVEGQKGERAAPPPSAAQPGKETRTEYLPTVALRYVAPLSQSLSQGKK